jgi:hypothetical protein
MDEVWRRSEGAESPQTFGRGQSTPSSPTSDVFRHIAPKRAALPDSGVADGAVKVANTGERMRRWAHATLALDVGVRASPAYHVAALRAVVAYCSRKPSLSGEC